MTKILNLRSIPALSYLSVQRSQNLSQKWPLFPVRSLNRNFPTVRNKNTCLPRITGAFTLVKWLSVKNGVCIDLPSGISFRKNKRQEKIVYLFVWKRHRKAFILFQINSYISSHNFHMYIYSFSFNFAYVNHSFIDLSNAYLPSKWINILIYQYFLFSFYCFK